MSPFYMITIFLSYNLLKISIKINLIDLDIYGIFKIEVYR